MPWHLPFPDQGAPLLLFVLKWEDLSGRAWILTLGEVRQTRLSVPSCHQVDGVVLVGQRVPHSPCDPALSPRGETPRSRPQRRADGRQPRALQHRGLRLCRAFVAKLGSQGGPVRPPGTPASHAPSTSGPPGNTQGTDTRHSWGLRYMPPVQTGDDRQPHASDAGTEPDGGAVTTGAGRMLTAGVYQVTGHSVQDPRLPHQVTRAGPEPQRT